MPGQSVPPSSVLLYPTCFFFTFLCSIQNEIMSLICSLLLVVCNSPVACKSSEPRTRPASIQMGEGAHTEQLSRFQLLSSPYLGDHLLKGPRMFTGKRASCQQYEARLLHDSMATTCCGPIGQQGRWAINTPYVFGE